MTHRKLVPEADFQKREFTIVFAITTKSKKEIDVSLPFFSRLALRRTARILNLRKTSSPSVGDYASRCRCAAIGLCE